MADFFDEVKEAYKQEQFIKNLKKALPHISLLVFAVIIVTGVSLFLKQYREKQHEASALIYDSLSEAYDHQQFDEVRKIVKEHAETLSHGYQSLTKLRLLQVEYEAGNHQEAIKIAEEIYGNGNYEREIRDLGGLLSAYISMEKLDSNEDFSIKRLQEISKEDAPWRFFALELQGIISLKKGDKEKAASIFSNLASSAELPQGMRMRVEALRVKAESK